MVAWSMQVPPTSVESAAGADDRAAVGSCVVGAAVCGADVTLWVVGFAGIAGTVGATRATGEVGATAGALVAVVTGAAAAAAALVLALCETLVVICPTDDEPVVVDWHAAAVKTVIAQAKADAHLCRSMVSLPKDRRPPPTRATTLALFGTSRNA